MFVFRVVVGSWLRGMYVVGSLRCFSALVM